MGSRPTRSEPSQRRRMVAPGEASAVAWGNAARRRALPAADHSEEAVDFVAQSLCQA